MKSERWQRFGITEHDLSDYYFKVSVNCKKSLTRVEGYPAIPPHWDASAVIDAIVSDGCLDAAITHLGLCREGPDTALPSARRAADFSVDYYYGEWREGYEALHGYSPDELDWIDVYRPAVMCAACLDRDVALEKLFAWPSYGGYSNEGAFDLKPADVRFYLIVAATLRGDEPSRVAKLIEAVQGQRRRAPKLLVNAFRAIQDGDHAAYTKTLAEYLKDRRKRHLKPRDVWTVFSLEGTLPYHLARRAGMPDPGLPLDLQDLIVTRETLGG